MEFLIKLTTQENKIVLDSFMGSGTTALATLNTNRNYIGFEVNNDYYKASQNRLIKNSSFVNSENHQENYNLF